MKQGDGVRTSSMATPVRMSDPTARTALRAKLSSRLSVSRRMNGRSCRTTMVATAAKLS